MKFNKNKFGFTITSLLVYFSIFVLLASIGIPYLRRYQPNLKLNGSARELVSDLRYAQQLTITEQVVHQVLMDEASGSYEILKIDTATTTIKSIVFPPEVSFSEITGLTDDKVIFNSYGAVSESGRVVLINIEGNQSIINIKPSGYIQLEQ